jgi:hypothetical protein
MLLRRIDDLNGKFMCGDRETTSDILEKILAESQGQ